MNEDKITPMPAPDMETQNEPQQVITNLQEVILANELNQGVIRINGPIFDLSATKALREIEYLVSAGVKSITFIISSPGGSPHDALALYDRIAYLPKQKIKTEAIVEGMAASAASMIILQAAQKRLATPNSRMMLHEPRRWAMYSLETVSDMEDNTKELGILADYIYTIMSKRMKKSKKYIHDLLERREVWLSAKEALKMKVIDKIII